MSNIVIDLKSELEVTTERILYPIPVFYLGATNIVIDEVLELKATDVRFLYELPVFHLSNPNIVIDLISELKVTTDKFVVDDAVFFLSNTNNIFDYYYKLDAAATPSPIAIDQAPRIIDFTGEPHIGPAPLIVQFQHFLPEYATLIEWDFGDGETSILDAPEHLYPYLGEYETTLKAMIHGQVFIGKKKSFVRVTGGALVPDHIDERTVGTIFQSTFKTIPNP